MFFSGRLSTPQLNPPGEPYRFLLKMINNQKAEMAKRPCQIVNCGATKKRRRTEQRNILVFPGKKPGEDVFCIDEDDYRIVRDYLRSSTPIGYTEETIQSEARMICEIRGADRRVYGLCVGLTSHASDLFFHSITKLDCLENLDLSKSQIPFLPSSIGQLKQLKILNLSEIHTLIGIPEEIGNLTALETLNLAKCWQLTSLPPSIGNLENLRNLCLRGIINLIDLPEEIWNLTNLTTLDLDKSLVEDFSLPPSIGRLKNLRVLNLPASGSKSSLELPDKIGDLVHLEEFRCTSIASLPPTIGRLVNLKDLSLKNTMGLTELPEEIGELTCLGRLTIVGSLESTPFPPSIGKLKNLKYLNLSKLSDLLELPEAIGDLVGLTELNLHRTKITSLPPAIGRLANLEHLNLSNMPKLRVLPNELTRLSNLKTLNLQNTNVGFQIFSLPGSEKLKNLMYLNAGFSPDVRRSFPFSKNNSKEDVLSFVLGCPALGALNISTRSYCDYEKELIGFLLARNRGRFRTSFYKSKNSCDKNGNSSSQRTVSGTEDATASTAAMNPYNKCLPLLLANATRAFRNYPCISDEDLTNTFPSEMYHCRHDHLWLQDFVEFDDDNIDVPFRNAFSYEMERPDAIYRLLCHGSQFFVNHIVSCRTR